MSDRILEAPIGPLQLARSKLGNRIFMVAVLGGCVGLMVVWIGALVWAMRWLWQVAY
jgi:hypothetical protein